MTAYLKSEKGFALVLVILILSVLIAVVTEFAYSVRNETVSLYSWRDMQRLSLEAQSGIKMADNLLQKNMALTLLNKQEGRIDLPIPDVTGDGRDSMILSAVDESGKLNLNKLVNERGTENWQYYSFKRLLRILQIDESIADRVADWIDNHDVERVRGSKVNAKKGKLYSIDELLSIDGITEEIYKKLLPHVTIFGTGLININSADKYVLMSLDDEVTEDLANRVINTRELSPAGFENAAKLQQVAGWASIYSKLGRPTATAASVVTANSSAISINVTALQENLKRNITAVIEIVNNKFVYKYWKEY